jgi:hypothetical protein
MCTVDLPIMVAAKFFSRELPRRAIFQEIEAAGLHVVDYGCQVKPFMDQDGNEGVGYHKYYLTFADDVQAVQFKLTYLC